MIGKAKKKEIKKRKKERGKKERKRERNREKEREGGKMTKELPPGMRTRDAVPIMNMTGMSMTG